MHFQPFEGLKFHKYSGGACPRTPLAYDCSHVRVGADASDDHDGGGDDDYGVFVVVVVVPFRNSWFLSRRTWRPRPRPPAALWRSGGESRQENRFHPTSAECSGWKKEVWLWKKVPSIPKAFNPTTEEGSHKPAGYPDPLPSGWNMVFIRGPVRTESRSGWWNDVRKIDSWLFVSTPCIASTNRRRANARDIAIYVRSPWSTYSWQPSVSPRNPPIHLVLSRGNYTMITTHVAKYHKRNCVQVKTRVCVREKIVAGPDDYICRGVNGSWRPQKGYSQPEFLAGRGQVGSAVEGQPNCRAVEGHVVSASTAGAENESTTEWAFDPPRPHPRGPRAFTHAIFDAIVRKPVPAYSSRVFRCVTHTKYRQVSTNWKRSVFK